MKKKYKLTGFARLVIFLIFFLPLLYLGVSIYHGENPLEKYEHLWTPQKTQSEDKPYISRDRFGINDDADLQDKLKSKDAEIEGLKNRIRSLERELNELKDHSHDD